MNEENESHWAFIRWHWLRDEDPEARRLRKMKWKGKVKFIIRVFQNKEPPHVYYDSPDHPPVVYYLISSAVRQVLNELTFAFLFRELRYLGREWEILWQGKFVFEFKGDFTKDYLRLLELLRESNLPLALKLNKL